MTACGFQQVGENALDVVFKVAAENVGARIGEARIILVYLRQIDVPGACIRRASASNDWSYATRRRDALVQRQKFGLADEGVD